MRTLHSIPQTQTPTWGIDYAARTRADETFYVEQGGGRAFTYTNDLLRFANQWFAANPANDIIVTTRDQAEIVYREARRTDIDRLTRRF